MKWIPIAACILISCFLHLDFLEHPNEVVFDEVHMGKFITSYTHTHKNHYDVHPPAARLLMALGATMTGYQARTDFAKIGNRFEGGDRPINLRIVPVFAGVLLILGAWLLVLLVSSSWLAANLAAVFLTFENAHLVQTSIGLTDGIMIAATLFCPVFAIAAVRSRGLWVPLLLFFSGLMAAIAVGTKFSGLASLGLGILAIAWEMWLRPHLSAGRALKMISTIVVACTCCYLIFWKIHFDLTTAPGPGDRFLKAQGSLVVDVVKVHKKMMRSHHALVKKHSFSSEWYEWPKMKKPIYMWHKKNRRVYLLGNPLVWYGSTGGVLISIFVLGMFIWRRRNKPQFLPEDPQITGLLFLVLAYLGTFVPFMLISRTLFLYHYLIPLCFAVMITALLVAKAMPLAGKSKPLWLATIMILVVASFIFVAPVTYGGELSGKWWEYLRMIIK